MARIDIPAGDDPESIRLLGLQPSMGNAMAVLADAIYSKSSLNVRVREAIRMRVAQINQCQICLQFRFPELLSAGIDEEFYEAVTNWRQSEILNASEKLGVEYAELFIQDHLRIDDVFFKKLKNKFSEIEIFEMTTTIAGLLASGRLMQVLQIEQSCAI